ncbi:MAG: site-2 protease family protein, partial [Polyangiaceae bacterium]
HSHLVALSSAGDGLQLGDSLLLRLLDHWFSPKVTSGMDLSLSTIAFAAWTGMFVTMINLLPAGQLDGGHVAFSLFGPRQNRIAQWVHRSMLVFFFVSVGSFVVRDVRAGTGLGDLAQHLGEHVNDSLFWFVWFEVLAVLGVVTVRGRDEAEAPSPLGMRTRAFGTLGLALLAGIFHDSASPILWIAWFGALGVLLAMEVKWGALRESSVLVDHPPTSDEPLSLMRAIVAVVTLAFFPLLFMPIPMAM